MGFIFLVIEISLLTLWPMSVLLLRRKFYIFLGQGQVSTSTRIHGVAKLSALRLYRSHCCCYSSASSQSTRHASTCTLDEETEDSVAFTIMRRIRRFILGAGACFGAVAFMCRLVRELSCEIFVVQID